MNFQPVNRHMLVEPISLEKEETQVLLPDDYKPSEEQYRLCKVLKIANDCTKNVRPTTLVVVSAAMIEEIKISDRVFHLVLENYIVGVLDED